jgi:DNA-binding PadR family transcriptional regulator
MVIELGPNSFKPKLSPIQLLLLVQLENSPKYGYEMLKTIREELDGVWIPKTGTIYPAIKSLEKNKLIIKYEKEGVDFYNITENGRNWLINIPNHQKQNMDFAIKYMKSIIKLSSPKLKEITIKSMIENDDILINFMQVIITVLNEDIDKNLKLSILKKISKNYEISLKIIKENMNKIEERD